MSWLVQQYEEITETQSTAEPADTATQESRARLTSSISRMSFWSECAHKIVALQALIDVFAA
jgi:hypothetical protein